MMELIGLAVFGLIVGIIAKLIMPGNDPGGMIITALLGMAGSLLGTFIGRNLLGLGQYYQAKWLMSILGAIVLLALYRVIAGSRR
ncbi:MAG: GlsB/YeaQ/YmgE family stress response membrane protein [Blastocatellia bacterium]